MPVSTRLALMDFLTENIVRTDGPQVTGRDGVHQPLGREQRKRTTGERTITAGGPDLAVGVGVPRGVEIERLSESASGEAGGSPEFLS